MIRVESLFKAEKQVSSIEEPLSHLMACHRRIEERLDTMHRAAAQLEDNRAAALDAFRSAFEFLETSGALHTADEEESLFPRLRLLMEPGEHSYLASLEHDHAEAGRLYAELKASFDQPDEIVKTRGLVERLTALYRQHIASEDDALQAYAMQLLRREELTAIANEMKLRRGWVRP